MDINRKTAFDALVDIHTGGAYSNIAVNRAIEKNHPDDEAFTRNLVYGVIENQIYLDHRLGQLMKQPLRKVKAKALILMRMGAYQIDFADSVPDYAAINESVAIAKKVCRGLDGFVNGVLRSYARREGQFEMPDPEKDIVQSLAVRYSYSRDIASMWVEMLGAERAEKLMKAGNEAPPLTIRVNRLKTDSDKLTQALESQGFRVSVVKTGDQDQDRLLEGLALNVSGSGLIASKEYREGLFSVQDISSMLAVKNLDPKPGETIIDLCAAPGGKSLCAAELMGNDGRLISCDIHEHKTELMDRAARRLGVNIMQVMQNDALKVREEFLEAADRVIVDAPCSGLGVVRRRPEIKLRISEKDIRSLADIQLGILENAAGYVKEKGYLMYSTCTVSKYENERITEMFLQKNKTFLKICEKQLMPDIDSSDGFYFTVLQRL